MNDFDQSIPGAKIKVLGIGGGGTNAVSTMIRSAVEGVDFIAANTDLQSLKFSLAQHKIQLGKDLTKGLGAGANPEVGRDAALEDRQELQESIVGADMVFVTAGMGGGTGTGAASIAAQIAKESGALTVGVVTKPFAFEGKKRLKQALEGIERLREFVDTLIVIPNQQLLRLATPDLSMIDAFNMADNVLVNAVRGISDIINIPGTVNVDFADVKTVMSCTGRALMGIGTASGDRRAAEAATQAVSSPILEDVDIEGATGILINITAGHNASLLEINEACSIIQEASHDNANIIFGAVIDESLVDEIRVTVIATGFPAEIRQEETESISAPAPHFQSTYEDSTAAASPAAIPSRDQRLESTPPQEDHLVTDVPRASEPTALTAPADEPTGLDSHDLAFLTLGNHDSEQETMSQSTNDMTPTPVTAEPIPGAMEIDKKIDEALSYAEKVSAIDKMSDDLEVPTFLRKGKESLTNSITE